MIEKTPWYERVLSRRANDFDFQSKILNNQLTNRSEKMLLVSCILRMVTYISPGKYSVSAPELTRMKSNSRGSNFRLL